MISMQGSMLQQVKFPNLGWNVFRLRTRDNSLPPSAYNQSNMNNLEQDTAVYTIVCRWWSNTVLLEAITKGREKMMQKQREIMLHDPRFEK